MPRNSTGSKGTAGKGKAAKPNPTPAVAGSADHGGAALKTDSAHADKEAKLSPTPAGADNADVGVETLKKDNAPAEADAKPDDVASAAGAVADTGAGKKTTTRSIPGLEVISSQDGFRRAGFAWARQATFIALDELSAEEVASLEQEPMLTVRRVEVAPEAIVLRASK